MTADSVQDHQKINIESKKEQQLRKENAKTPISLAYIMPLFFVRPVFPLITVTLPPRSPTWSSVERLW